jgi:hypothetical protein
MGSFSQRNLSISDVGEYVTRGEQHGHPGRAPKRASAARPYAATLSNVAWALPGAAGAGGVLR